MLSETGQRSERVRRSGRRSRRQARAGVALAALASAGLLAATAAGAPPPAGGATVFTHSAASGKLTGGRLILHGVGRRVTWAHHSGRSGVMAVKPMHRMLFKPGTATATGTLHVAGHRGGDELTFRLSRPRHNAARHTVSYRARPLNNKQLPGEAASAAQATRRFGAASLSIVAEPGPQSFTLTIDNSGGSYDCTPGTGLCWGALMGSGLQPNSVVHVIGSGPGFTGTHATVQLDGSVSANLNLPCNVHNVFIGGTAGDGTLTGKLGPFDPPGTCPQ
jgi:hypothetical protein